MNKNSVYVINQPKHSLITFIKIDYDSEVNEDIHNKIDLIQGVSDIMFIFDPKVVNTIDPFKFTELYQSASFIVSDGNLHKTLFEAFLYAKEVYETHVSYIVTDILKLGDVVLGKEGLDNIIRVHVSALQKPICKVRRSTFDELKAIYTVEEGDTSKGGGFFKRNKETVLNNEGRYYTWTCESDLVFVRKATVDLILKEYENDRENPDSKINDILDSFKDYTDLGDMLVSYLKRLGVDMIEDSIESIKGVGDLKYDK